MSAVAESGSGGTAWPARCWTSSSGTPWQSRSVMTAPRNEGGERSEGREASRRQRFPMRAMSLAEKVAKSTRVLCGIFSQLRQSIK